MVNDLSEVTGRLVRLPEYALQTGIGLALRGLALAGTAVRLGRTVIDAVSGSGAAVPGAAETAIWEAPVAPAPVVEAPPAPEAPERPLPVSTPLITPDSEAAPEAPAADDLPIPDIDHLTVPSLRARLRSLSLEELHMIRAYEEAHAHRAPVLTAIDNRIRRLGSPGREPHDNVG